MDQSGRIYVTLQPPGDLVLTFDTVGRFLGRIGNKGRGPGEFVFPAAVLARENGEIVIWDFNAAMLTTLDSRHSFVRRHHQPSPPAAILDDGRQVVVAAMFDRGRIGYPMHFYDQSGKLLSSFGETGRAYSEADRWRLSRAVHLSPRGTIWAAHPDRYAIEEWDAKLSKRRTYTREVTWMPTVTVRSDGVFGERPSARILALFEENGLLWVFSRIPSAEWRAALGQPTSRPGRRASYPNRDEGRLYDTMVDVIDLNSNSLLVSERIREHIRFALRGNVVASYREVDGGVPLLDVMKVQFYRSSRR